jgi:hypothetical protein
LEGLERYVTQIAMALWAMTATHSQWQMPTQEPFPVVQTVAGAKPEYSSEERDQLRAALERFARCATGKLVYDQTTGVAVPQQKPDCR